MPEGGKYLWDVFIRLHRRRGSNGFGNNPISYGDLDAFLRNSRLALDPWEIRAIELMDDAFLDAQGKAQAANAPPTRPGTK